MSRRKVSGSRSGRGKIDYGSPPKHTQFKPGQSGNPKGRPKGSHNLLTDFKAVIEESVSVTRDGKTRSVSGREAVLLRLLEKALKGGDRAIDRTIDLIKASESDEPVAEEYRPANDEALLATYQQRMLSGTVGPLAKPNQDYKSAPPGSDDASPRSKPRPLKRVRLKC